MQVTNEDARIYYVNIKSGGRNKRALLVPGKNDLSRQGFDEDDFAAFKASDYVKALRDQGSIAWAAVEKKKTKKKAEAPPEPVAPKPKKKKTAKKKTAKKKAEPAEGW